MTTIKILFDTEAPSFAPNSEVTGSVLVETAKPLKADQLILKVSGKALTSFFRSKPNSIKNFTKPLINYKAEETYLYEKYILWQAPDKSAKFPLGPQKFDFHFWLPKNCQPSFACKEAKIVYSVKADIFYSKKSVAADESVISVSSSPDLTLKDILGQLGKKEARFLSNHNSAHPIEARISLPKKVYCPGESIHLTVDIDNKSSLKIDSVNTGIITLAYCKGQAVFGKTNPTIKEETEAIKSQDGVLEEQLTIEPNCSHKYTRSIKVPKLIPSIFESNVISTVHTVYVTIHSAATTVLIGSLPIVISTHPDHTLQHPQSAHPRLTAPLPFHHTHHTDDSAIPRPKPSHPILVPKLSNASNASSSLSRRDSPYSSLSSSISSLASNPDKPKKTVRFDDALNIKFNNDHLLHI